MSCAGDHRRAGPSRDEHEPQEAMHPPAVASDVTGDSADESKTASEEPANQLWNTATFVEEVGDLFSMDGRGEATQATKSSGGIAGGSGFQLDGTE